MVHDYDDPPRQEAWNFWYYANRAAEEWMRLARALGLIP